MNNLNKEELKIVIKESITEDRKRRKKRFQNILIRIAFILIVGLLFIGFILGMYTVSIDSKIDIRSCEIGLQGRITGDLKTKSCYANDDFLKLNSMKDIDCVCFYYDKYDYSNNYIGEFVWFKSTKFNIK